MELANKILTVYALTFLIQRLRGPFQLVEQGRGKLYDLQNEQVNELLACPFCLSFWISLVVMILPSPVTGALGAWGGAMLLFQQEHR